MWVGCLRLEGVDEDWIEWIRGVARGGKGYRDPGCRKV